MQAFVGEAPIEATLLESHHGGEVHLLEADVSRQADIRGCLGALTTEAAQAILDTLEARTDDDGVLYFRLDKQEAFLGRLSLVAGGDALQCRAKIEVHPTGRERALAAWRAWWESSS